MKTQQSLYEFKLLGILLLVCAITGCVTISTFASLVGIPIGVACSAVGLKICVISTVIEK